MTNKLLPILILTLLSCGESFDKLRKTEDIVNEYDMKTDGEFFMEASIEGDQSELTLTLNHEPFQAYYTNALYEIILELHKNKISYNHYSIKDVTSTIIWEIDDSIIPEITKTIAHSKRLMELLENKKYDDFLSYSNLVELGVSDSVFLASIEQTPVYPNTEFKGFSFKVNEINGEKREFMYVYFMNDEKKENMLVIDPNDQRVYGLEF